MKIVIIWKTSYGFYENREDCKKRKVHDYRDRMPEIPKKVFAILDEEGNYHPIQVGTEVHHLQVK